eukprot:TRINITY_DN4271_c0_g1_i7.p1 TRINITY_DN4271_c0_g1~~TRINITY_DN4271_c0_g1_i7.p1  ORF type:complete len:299 (-),score=54.45 TRINITY_DN4271_c0_g1_i7:372-1268(-)
MSKLSFVWVKEEGEQDEKSQKIQISSGAYISDLIRILYADQLFERSISSGRSIDCLLTEGKTVSNQYVVNHNFVYEVRFKFNSESVKDDDIEKMKLEIQQFEKRIQRYEKQIQTEREGFQKQIQTEREGFEQQLQRYEKQIQTEREGFEQQLQRFEKQIQTERKGFQKQIQRLKKEVDYLRTDNELLVQAIKQFQTKPGASQPGSSQASSPRTEDNSQSSPDKDITQSPKEGQHVFAVTTDLKDRISFNALLDSGVGLSLISLGAAERYYENRSHRPSKHFLISRYHKTFVGSYSYWL